jgi:thiamine transport system permease protein
MNRLYNLVTLGISGFLFIIILGAFYQLFRISITTNSFAWNDAYLNNIIIFTLVEAILSAFLVILISVPLARALHRNPNFVGRKILIQFFSVAFIMPVMVVITGLVFIHGTNGWINQFFANFQVNFGSYFYGLGAILTAHLVFNLPFVSRLILSGLESIPNEFWRIGNQLGMKSQEIFWHIELPIIKNTILKAFGLVFMMCFTSFSVILTLGGNIKYTTLEVAIYQALKIDFDLPHAAILSLIQFIICTGFICWVYSLMPTIRGQMTERGKFLRPDSNDKANRIFDFSLIIISFLVIVSPLIAIILKGINSMFFPTIASSEFRKALLGSLKISFISGLLSLFISTGLINLFYNIKYIANKPTLSNKIVSSVNVILCIPPFIIVTCILATAGEWCDIYHYSTLMLIIINSLTVLPFVVNTVISSLHSITQVHRWLAMSLGVTKSQFFRYVIWPEIRHAIGFALAVAITLCIGSLGVMNLLGSDSLITLPLLLYQKLANFQLEEGSVIALSLLIISYILFWSIEKFVGGEK